MKEQGRRGPFSAFRGRAFRGRRGGRLALGLGVASAVIVALALALDGRGETGSDRVRSLEGGAAVGEMAPAFVVTTVGGTSFTLPAQKPAVLFFMAGWCATCLPEAEALDRIERSVGDRVAILAVDADPADSRANLEQFIASAGSPRYGFAHDRDGRLVAAFDAQALDTTVVVDAAGRVVYRDAVPTDEPVLRRALAKAGM